MILRDGIRIVTSAIGVIDSIRVCLCETVMMRLFVMGILKEFVWIDMLAESHCWRREVKYNLNDLYILGTFIYGVSPLMSSYL